MYKKRLFPNAEYLKVASIIGATLDFHPHGESSVHGSIVKLAQPWNNIQCLVDGSGNFGSIDGASAGAARYIEARLTKYAYKCFFEEYSHDIVNTKLNYLRREVEPEYLPSKYPNVLINNTYGIGYGMATSIATYNLKDIIDLTLELMDDPTIEDIVMIPDSPTGAHIVDDGKFGEISRTGRGSFRMRGVIEIDEEKNALIITSTPLQVYWEMVQPTVLKLLNTGKVNLMSKYVDNGEINDMRKVIYLKKEVDPYSIREMIYKKTQMEKTFFVNFKLTEDYQDREYNIKSILLTWIDFRRETKRRYYNHQLTKFKERQHILDILLFILDKNNAEDTLKIIKTSENNKEIATRLMKAYNISSLQADIIANMKMSAFSKESYRKYVEEKIEIDKNCDKVEKIIRSAKKIDKIIKDELKEGIELFGEERRSKIITVDNEELIRDTKHIMIFTNKGFIKKLPIDVKSIGTIAQGDYPIDVIECSNTSDLLLFDEFGKIFKLPVHSVRGTVMSDIGVKITDHCNINGKVVAIKPKPTLDVLEKVKEPVYFVMITKNGTVKKTLADAYVNIRNELLGLIVKDTDRLVSVKLITGDPDVLVYTNKGFGVRFNSSDIREGTRITVGSKALDLQEQESVIGLDILHADDTHILVMTSKGMCKKSSLEYFKTMNRASKPLRIVTLDDSDDVLLMRTIKGKEIFKIYLKNSIESLDVRDVPQLPRLSKGKKMIKVSRGDNIIDIKEA